MADKKKTGGQKTATKSDNFEPTFRKFDSMNPGEQAAFKQGATTVANRVKENLGLKQKKQ